MKFDYIHILGQGLGTSRDHKVVAKLHMVSVNMNKIVKEIFMSLRFVQFFVYLFMLMHD